MINDFDDTLLESAFDDFALEADDKSIDAAESGNGKKDAKGSEEADGEPAELEKNDKTAEESLAAAALLDLASPDEIADIAESVEDQQAISDMMGVAMERTIVRFDRKGRMSHLQKMAVFNVARQNNDPNFKKLEKLWSMERILEKKLSQRWGTKGNKIARIQIKDYDARGRKKANINKPNPSTLAFKGKVSSAVAQRAVSNAKRMFSNKKPAANSSK